MMRWYYWPDKARSEEATCFDKIQLNELICLGNRVWVSSSMRLSCYEDVLVLFSVGCFNKKWPASQRTIYIRKLWSASGKEHISRLCTTTFSGGYHCSSKRQLSSAKSLQKLFPRFGGEIKTGGWAGRGLPSWNKVQTNMHSHFQDWEKNGSVKYFLLTGTMLQQISIFTSNLQKWKWKFNDSLWWEQCSK